MIGWTKTNPKRVKRSLVEPIRDPIKRAKQRRKEYFAELRTRPCHRCGWTFPPCAMDVHHTDPRYKGAKVKTLEDFAHERRTVITLCACCHRMEEFKRRGTNAWTREAVEARLARLRGELAEPDQFLEADEEDEIGSDG